MKTNIITLFVLFVSAFLSAQDYSYIPLKQKPISDSLFVEHVAFVGNYGRLLDGPAPEAMGFSNGTSSIDYTLAGFQSSASDSTGNIFMYDMNAHVIRAIRKMDNRVFTLTGNGFVSFGEPTMDSGPAHTLRFQNLGGFVWTIGKDVMKGDGSILVAAKGTYNQATVRIYRHKERGNIWWYQWLGGGVLNGPAMSTGLRLRALRSCILYPLKSGELIAFNPYQTQLYHINGDLVGDPIIDTSIAKRQNVTNTTLIFQGIDVNGKFIYLPRTGAYIYRVTPDGKTLDSIALPYHADWGLRIDQKREQYIYVGQDDYSINRVNPQGEYGSLNNDGTWIHKAASNTKLATLLGFNWRVAMQDGRVFGFSVHNGGPFFALSFINGNETEVEDMPANLVNMNLVSFPNPGSRYSILSFFISPKQAGADMELSVYDVSGALVRTLMRGLQAAGTYKVRWNGQNNAGQVMAAGRYVVRLKCGMEIKTQSLMLTR